jgi:hypothetical protein
MTATIAGVLGFSLLLALPVFRADSEAAASIPAAANPSRERISFNADWRFQKGDPVDMRASSPTTRSKAG